MCKPCLINSYTGDEGRYIGFDGEEDHFLGFGKRKTIFGKILHAANPLTHIKAGVATTKFATKVAFKPHRMMLGMVAPRPNAQPLPAPVDAATAMSTGANPFAPAASSAPVPVPASVSLPPMGSMESSGSGFVFDSSTVAAAEAAARNMQGEEAGYEDSDGVESEDLPEEEYENFLGKTPEEKKKKLIILVAASLLIGVALVVYVFKFKR